MPYIRLPNGILISQGLTRAETAAFWQRQPEGGACVVPPRAILEGGKDITVRPTPVVGPATSSEDK